MKARKFFIGVRSEQSDRYFNLRYDSGAQYNPTAIDNQFVRISFVLVDNPEFRNGLMAKARFRTYKGLPVAAVADFLERLPLRGP